MVATLSEHVRQCYLTTMPRAPRQSIAGNRNRGDTESIVNVNVVMSRRIKACNACRNAKVRSKV